jgi:hypothetical protein
MLNERQRKAFDTGVPGVGSTAADSAGSIIQKLITQGGDPLSVSLGTGVTGTGAGVLNAVYVTYTSNATANTADSVAHALGRIPVGYIVVNNGNGGVVYNGGVAFSGATISLKCTTASNAVTLLVF